MGEVQDQKAEPQPDQLIGKAIPKYMYRVAGVPTVMRRAFAPPPRDAREVLRDAYARQYFHTRSAKDRQTVRRALLQWPFVLAWQVWRYTRLNGRIIANRYGTSIGKQVLDQLLFYFRYGILPRWYYIFSLYQPDVRGQARCFINRYETKLATFRLLNWPGKSPLNDKAEFANHCRKHGIPTVSPIATAVDGAIDWTSTDHQLPPRDLFAKPVCARGGKGAERWDYAGDGQFRNMGGQSMSADALLERFRAESFETPRLIQPRLVNHGGISDLSNGALCTVRIMTCLDEMGEPEAVASVFRMAVGKNVTVDNIHAGGVAAEIGLTSGRLGPASNLGDNSELGWLDSHPDTGAQIAGRVLPLWNEVLSLAVQAHRAFADRTVVGWDIAITTDGPLLVEGNSGPDVDLLQRPMRRGLGCGRLGELMAFHLEMRGWGPSTS